MDRFTELETFVAVMETGSLSGAARRLGVAVSAVSRRMDELEARLGASLARRSTRGFSPSAIGAAYYEAALKLLGDLSEADAAARGEQAARAGPLRIAAPMSFGQRHLAPLFADLAAEAEALRLDIDFSDRRVDVIGEGYDLAIRIGRLGESTLKARKLCDIDHRVVASPGYWAQAGAPQRPEDLRRCRILAYQGAMAGPSWSYVDPSGRAGAVSVTPCYAANNGDVLITAALRGLGVALQPTFIMGEALASGALVPAMTDYVFAPMAAYLVFPPDRAVTARARFVMDRLISAFSGPAPWDAWRARL